MTLARARSSKSRALNLAFCLGMAVLCVGMLVPGSRWLRAEQHRDVAINLMAKWKAAQDVSLDEWETAHAAMQRAVALHESRANLHYFLGYLYELRVAAPYDVGARLTPQAQQLALYQVAATDLRRAGSAYRASLARGPSLPDTWSRLALSKQTLGILDAEFMMAYRNTWRYGKNVSGLHLALTELSSRFYAQIRANEEAASIQTAHLQNVLSRRSARQHMDLIAKYGILPQVCSMALDEGWALEAYAERSCGNIQDGGRRP